MLWCPSMPVSNLECAITKNAPASPLQFSVTKLLDLKSLRISSYKNVGVGGVNFLGGVASLADPMGFTVKQSFDGGDRRGESNSGARGGACWLRKLLRRGYDAVPVEDLRFDDV